MNDSVWQHYLSLCKPKVVALMLLTAWVGMILAAPPTQLPWLALSLGTLGIAFCASSAAVINHLVERHIDVHMKRTQHRPVASGKISPSRAFVFSLILGLLGLGILVTWVNTLTACLTFATLIGYAMVYTLFLKQATPQNIVIGGLAGAAPPLLGWTAVTNQIDPFGLILVLIIFTWTPPHFWALAIYRRQEYQQAGLPMLPVTHGVPYTKLNIVLYTVLLIVTTVLPFAFKMCGLLYLLLSTPLNLGFLYYAVKLYRNGSDQLALKVFGYSILYLMGLFLALILDHYFSWVIFRTIGT
ncbi:MAG: heme o synthase [Gammaproteobacteria bacterium]